MNALLDVVHIKIQTSKQTCSCFVHMELNILEREKKYYNVCWHTFKEVVAWNCHIDIWNIFVVSYTYILLSAVFTQTYLNIGAYFERFHICINVFAPIFRRSKPAWLCICVTYFLICIGTLAVLFIQFLCWFAKITSPAKLYLSFRQQSYIFYGA